mmetsp:Transcript_23904/g.27672  ORF Transcript_23904/g.27672 Transcript_23904/m.27672 type:complete len:195 (-) Transcript_23904:469-1053(-)
MKLLNSLALLTILFTIASATEQLNQETFQTFMSSGKNGMIKFYQDWCGHCKRMKPDWDRLAKEESNDKVLIADVDCGQQTDLCDLTGVQGYPTIKYYVDGKEHDYNHGRSFEDLSEFVKDKLASQCTFANEDNVCSERAVKYINKWSAKSISEREKESKRLEGLLFEEMKTELKVWVRERVIILKSSLTESAEL